jgi:phospholipase C
MGIRARYALSFGAAAVLQAGCGGSQPPIGAPGAMLQSSPWSRPPAFLPQASPLRNQKVQHVVVIIQENRSVDNLFQGFPGADTLPYGFNEKGQKIALRQVGLEARWDFQHSAASFLAACDGSGRFPGTDCRMDGFAREVARCAPKCPGADAAYSYVPHYETRPYFFMGSHYVFADRMFPSNYDSSSFVSHQYIIAAQASSTVNFPIGPWGCEGKSRIPTVTQQRTIGPDISPCLNNRTLADELDDRGLAWRFYTSYVEAGGGLWSAYQAIKHIYEGPDWHKDIVVPQTKFFRDVSAGDLPAVSWVTPTCVNSDHAGCGGDTGPDWVGALVNAIGESKYWDSTVIFVFWDDYGGWYDHVPPSMVNYDGLGIRVPMLIISAYTKAGCVSHVHYEHGSILKFIEDRWGLARLSASDTRANPISPGCFDYTKPPRPFTKVPLGHDRAYFLAQPLDTRPPDTE